MKILIVENPSQTEMNYGPVCLLDRAPVFAVYITNKKQYFVKTLQ